MTSGGLTGTTSCLTTTGGGGDGDMVFVFHINIHVDMKDFRSDLVLEDLEQDEELKEEAKEDSQRVSVSHHYRTTTDWLYWSSGCVVHGTDGQWFSADRRRRAQN